LPSTNRLWAIVVGFVSQFLSHELFARHSQHCREDSRVTNASRTKLTIDHPLPKSREVVCRWLHHKCEVFLSDCRCMLCADPDSANQ
jgi:hypothetical protein